MDQHPADHDLVARIRYLKENEGLSLRQIALRIGISRKKVCRLFSGTWKDPQPRTGQLDPFRDRLVGWFRQVPTLKACQAWLRLRQLGVAVSERTVERATRDLRRPPKDRIFETLTFLPGEEAQVDWFFLKHPVLGMCAGFVFVLSFSRYCFARFFPRHSFEFFIEGHLLAFDAIGGCPGALRYDNLKSVVIARTPLVYNSAFLDFARHYGFEIRLCTPAAGNEKGRVERLIRTLRGTFENTATSHQSMEALNLDLGDWIARKNAAIHRATREVPAQLLPQEKLRILPELRFANVLTFPGKRLTKSGTIVFETNAYSLPAVDRRELVTLRAFVDRIEILDAKGRILASHPRIFARHQSSILPTHRNLDRFSDRAKLDRIYHLMSGLAPEMARFLNMNADAGESPKHTAHALFKLLISSGRQTVLSLVREMVARNSPRLSSALSLFNAPNDPIPEPVFPQHAELLAIDYTPRSLETYDHETKR